MSSRKPRFQSKLGCSQCKKRRVKCDEGRPDCKNCAKRKLSCSFRTYDPLPRPFSKRLTPESEPSSSPAGSIGALPSPTFLDYLPQDELLVHFPDVLRPRFRHLLTHFALETSPTITHNDAARAAWCAAIPQLTAKHMFVLQGTMALSALHVSKFAPSEKERRHFREIATYQMNTGLIRYREALANVSEANAESLLVFSVTITAWTLFTTAYDFKALLSAPPAQTQTQTLTTSPTTSPSPTPTPPPTPPTRPNPQLRPQTLTYTTTLLRTLRGVLVILVPCWPLIASGILSPVAQRTWWPYPIPASPSALLTDARLQALERLWMNPDTPYTYTHDVLRAALRSLRDDFARVSQLTATATSKEHAKDPEGTAKSGSSSSSRSRTRSRYGDITDWTAVLTWPIGLPVGFLSEVERGGSEAWVLLAHYAMLPSRVEGVFWLREFGPDLVRTAAVVLGRGMRGWIEWPAGVVGVDLEAVFEGCGGG